MVAQQSSIAGELLDLIAELETADFVIVAEMNSVKLPVPGLVAELNLAELIELIAVAVMVGGLVNFVAVVVLEEEDLVG